MFKSLLNYFFFQYTYDNDGLSKYDYHVLTIYCILYTDCMITKDQTDQAKIFIKYYFILFALFSSILSHFDFPDLKIMKKKITYRMYCNTRIHVLKKKILTSNFKNLLVTKVRDHPYSMCKLIFPAQTLRRKKS
jgi:hypothetical protein